MRSSPAARASSTRRAAARIAWASRRTHARPAPARRARSARRWRRSDLARGTQSPGGRVARRAIRRGDRVVAGVTGDARAEEIDLPEPVHIIWRRDGVRGRCDGRAHDAGGGTRAAPTGIGGSRRAGARSTRCPRGGGESRAVARMRGRRGGPCRRGVTSGPELASRWSCALTGPWPSTAIPARCIPHRSTAKGEVVRT